MEILSFHKHSLCLKQHWVFSSLISASSSMAISVISKAVLITCLFMSLVVVYFVEADEMVNSIDGVAADPVKIQNIDCGGACATRCTSSSRPNLCKRACGTCCARCSCVPPGTSGGYETCPCYAGVTTRGGRPKCP